MGRMWGVWLIPLVGLALLATALWQVVIANRFKATARPAIGEVVSYIEYDSTDSKGYTSHLYDPVIRFSTADGSSIEQRSGMGSSPQPYAVGQRLKLLYNPAQPTDYRINSPFQIYFAAGVIGFIGLMFTIVGLVVGFIVAGPHPELVDTPAAAANTDATTDRNAPAQP